MTDGVNALTAVVWVLTAICWGMALYKLSHLIRDPGSRPLRALCLALVAITGSLTVQRMASGLDQLFGALDFGRVSANCLTVVAAGGGQAFLLYLTSLDSPTRRRVRRITAITAGCVVAIVVLYAITPPRYRVDDPYVLDGRYYHTPAPLITPYVFVHLGYVAWSCLQITRLAGGYARLATRPLLRLGLRLIVAGSVVSMLYVAVKLANMALWRLARGVPGLSESIIVVCFTTAILLILIGSTIPSWGPLIGLDRLVTWVTALYAHRQLAPLWTVLHQANPAIALLAQPRGWSAPIQLARQARLRLVRRVLEIRDGYLALRPYTDARAEPIARRYGERAGLVGDELEIVVEAAVIAVAVGRQRSGQAVPPHPVGGAARQPGSAADITGGDTADDAGGGTADDTAGAAGAQNPAEEVSWLTGVAAAYAGSPVVAATLAELGQPGGEAVTGGAPRDPSPGPAPVG